MTSETNSTSKIAAKSLLVCSILFLIGLQAIVGRADSTDGATPLALQPGTPAGSYALGNLDNINPYNGSLNFRLPLLNVAGRGTAAYTMTLPIEQKWRVNVVTQYVILYADGGGPPLPDPQVSYHYFPTANWWAGIKPGYGPGVLQGRVAQFDAQVCGDSTMRASMTLTRLTFTGTNGTEFELRDKQTDGAPATVGVCDANGLNRGRIFVTADGSAATFISDQNIVDSILVPNGGTDLFYPSGYLLLRDGTRYRIDNGTISWLRDRNGNKMTFTYDSFRRMITAKDSLNREVTVTYSTSSIPYDEIIYKGFGGATRTIRVNYANLQDAGSLRPGYAIQTYYQLFPMTGSSTTTNYNPKIVRSVTLPNNQQYQFQYNSYGELARVVLRTGGAFEYDYSGGFGGGDANGIVGGAEGPNIYRRVTTRRVYDDGTTMTSKTTFSGQNAISGNTNYVLMDQFDSDGSTRLNRQKVYYEGYAENSFLLLPTDYSPWKEGREFQSDSVAADGTTVLQRIARTWQQPVGGGSWPLTQPETNANAKPNNPQVTQTITTLEPAQANKVSKQTFTFDKYTNLVDVYEYDFGTGVAGALVRRRHTDYLLSSYDTLNPSSSNPDLNVTSHIRDLPAQVSVFDAGGVERARATTEYDNYVLDGSNCAQSFHCPLLARSNISGLDSSFTASYTMRGNPTASTSYLLSNGAVTGSVSAYSHYDVVGNVVRSIDPRSTQSNIIATTIEYDDRFGIPDNEARSNAVPYELTGFASFAFPTKITNPLGHTVYAQFDYYLGKSVNGEDANGMVASGSFNDSLDRPKQIRRGISTDAESQTTFDYDDANRIVTTASDLHANNDSVVVSKVLYDQMGRTKETRQYEGGSNYIAAQTQYDTLGRPYKTSNPFRPWQSETAVWITQTFDDLGRVISVTTPDNASVSTSYSGNAVTVTEQAGKKRKSVTDALGRLIEVYEDPNGLNYQTTYSYDVLDNLVKVTQGTQQRFFMYDSLKRLIRARNPEQGTLASLALSDPITGNSAWSIGYQYDANSNLALKTDARGVESTYAYDALNRNTTINYSDTTITPDVKWFYDGATNGKGRFWYFYKRGDSTTGADVDHTSVDSYDALGRPLVQRQLFKLNNVWSGTYQTSRAYNRAGGVTSQTYPSGHAVTYNYDEAGRLADKDASNLAFTGNLGDGQLRTYSRGVTYTQWGNLKREQFGTNTALYHKLRYNIRGQLCDVRASNVNDESGGELGALVNYYSTTWTHCGSGSDNNGNVLMSQTIVNSYYMEDRYSYDSLNRLSAVNEWQNGATNTGSQQYDYDRWGNRTIKPASWGIGINSKQFTVDTATNRLGVPAGQSGAMTYDAVGNLITDTYTGAGLREYDAENKMTRAWGGNNQSQYYTYNANGQRTRRKVDTVETWQVYGFDGELLAEYAANGPSSSPQKEYGYRNGQLLITAEPTQSLSATPASLAPSGSITLSWTAPSGHSTTDWIGLYAVGAANTAFVSFQYVPSGSSGTMNFTAPAVTGSYEFRYLPNNGYTSVATSNTVLVSSSTHLLSASPSAVAPSGSLTVNWTAPSGHSTTDWIGLYAVGAANTAFVSYQYVPSGTSGTLNFTAPAVTGSYEFRYLPNNGYTSVATSNRVTVTSSGGSAGAVRWLVTDHLGTPRMIIDETGSLANVKRHDYLPFGEEVFAGTGGRTVAQGYAGDAVRQQFTLKERDIETGLDYFLARYYSSIQGRFTSPDEFTGGPDELFDFTGVAAENPTFYADLTHPQSLNKYQYCYNNPLSYIDPDGHQQALTQRLMLERGPESRISSATKAVGGTVDAGSDVITGVGKGLANVGIGVNNLMATFRIGGAEYIEPYKGANTTQQAAIVATEDATFFLGLLGGRAQVGGVAIADAQETTAVASETGNALRQTKQGGAITQPNPAPTGTIVSENGVTIQRFTRDHAPPHLHVEGRGPNTRIGQNGRPLRNNPSLSRPQRQVVQNNRRTIRNTVRQVMKEHRYNNQ